MAEYIPPKKNVALIFYVALTSQADTKLLQASPTLATGDVIVELDGVSLGNITTLPTVTPAAGTSVKVSLSSDEMNGDNVVVKFSDVAGAQWCDLTISIQTAARQVADLAFPTTSGRGLDVTATGGAGIDWSNVEAPTTTLNLSGTTIKDATDVETAIAALNNLSSTQVAALLTATIADSIPADGTRPSIASGILMLTRFLMERRVSGVTMTVDKEDGSTGVMTFTLDSATAPTSITRAS